LQLRPEINEIDGIPEFAQFDGVPNRAEI